MDVICFIVWGRWSGELRRASYLKLYTVHDNTRGNGYSTCVGCKKNVFGFGTLEVVNRIGTYWKWIMDINDEGARFIDDVWLSNQYYSHSREYSSF